MGRAKLDMHLISKEKSRHTTFKKRKEGLVRKIQEFTTLCDVNACMIIHPPKQENCQAETEIWPENPDEVSRIINLYKANSNVGGSRNFALFDFYQCRKKKIQEELEKKRKKRMEMVYPTWIDSMAYLPETQLRDFATTLGNKLGFIKCRMEAIKGSTSMSTTATDHHFPGPVSQNRVWVMDAPPPPPPLPPLVSLFQRNMNEYDVSNPPPLNNPSNDQIHIPLMDHQYHHQQHLLQYHQQNQIHSGNSNPSSMMGLLMNENDHHNYHHHHHHAGPSSNRNIQYASFKQEILYASPSTTPSGGVAVINGGVGPSSGMLENAAGLYSYPMPLTALFHGQPLQQQAYVQYPAGTVSDVHIQQPNLQASKGKEYSDYFHYSMKDYKERR